MTFINNVNYELVTFDEITSQGNVAGKHKRNRKYVYMDRDATETVSVGETWFCELKEPPGFGNYYFAKPVKQLDESFLAHLDDDTLKDVAEFAARNYPEYLEKYLPTREPEPEPAPETEPEPADVNESAAETVVETGQEDSSGDHEITDDGVLPRFDVGDVGEGSICAIGGNTLRSVMFTEPTYRVCRNVASTKIQITPDDRGVITCEDNEISVEGLDELIGGELPVALKWVSCRGSIVITLPDNDTRRIRREEVSHFGEKEDSVPAHVAVPGPNASQIADFVFDILWDQTDRGSPVLISLIGAKLSSKFGNKCYTKIGFSSMADMLCSMGFDVDRGSLGPEDARPSVVRLSQEQLVDGSAFPKSTN